MDRPSVRTALLCGLLTAVLLDGIVALAFGSTVALQLMGFNMQALSQAEVAGLVIVILLLCAGGGALWGLTLHRLTGRGQVRTMVQVGAATYAPTVIVVALALGSLEPIAAKLLPLPIHRIFSLMFVPAAFLIAGLNAGAMGLALNDRALAGRLVWQVGLAAAAGFLIVNLTLDTSGFRVGAPLAAERATMLVTAFSSNAGAAFIGGTAMGWLLMKKG